MLEEAIILTLKEFGLNGTHDPTWRGVWVEDQKVASIGLAVKGGITYHGIALNVSPDMSYFDYIMPCGLKDVRMGSMSDLLGKLVSIFHVKKVYLEVMAGLFDLQLKPVTLKKVVETYDLSFSGISEVLRPQ